MPSLSSTVDIPLKNDALAAARPITVAYFDAVLAWAGADDKVADGVEGGRSWLGDDEEVGAREGEASGDIDVVADEEGDCDAAGGEGLLGEACAVREDGAPRQRRRGAF